MPPVGFEPTIPASERQQTYALDRVAIGFGTVATARYNVTHRGSLFEQTQYSPDFPRTVLIPTLPRFSEANIRETAHLRAFKVTGWSNSYRPFDTRQFAAHYVGIYSDSNFTSGYMHVVTPVLSF